MGGGDLRSRKLMVSDVRYLVSSKPVFWSSHAAAAETI
jgi:hypothetical protein